MKILAIADPYIPADMLEEGTSALREAGHGVDVVTWNAADSIERLQEINLLVEQHGPNAVPLDDDLSSLAQHVDVVITQFAPIGTQLVDAASNLKIIGVLRGGTENVDRQAAQARGIRVVNTPGRNARAVAEFAVGLILAETRNIARTHAAMMEHVWLKDFPNGEDIPELEGRTVGIVGAGAIGQLVMKFLTGMDATCVFYDPYCRSSPWGTKVEDLADLVAASDVLSIHSRLSADTHHLIDRDLLARMKPSAILVNTARSGLVDEEALLDCLEAGRIMGAAIDTFDREPLPADSRWLTLRNVTITSHLAGSTKDAFRKTPRMLSKRILTALEEG